MALQGKASQSSLYGTQLAYNAIDGNRASTFALGSCSCTASESNPWWRLDLRKTYKIFSIKITNRKQVPTRLNGAEIRIGDSRNNNDDSNARYSVGLVI